ncbi:hypothetical protein ABMA57_15700 [Saccharospirillum sp. HFRX-1]|uniref:hypothetical protein n=1 Tax=unclassified Saccharospirillum TaxID=2633430 RepID=UPI00371CF3A2
MNQEPPVDRRQRRKPDIWMRLLHISNVSAWIALLGFQCLWWIAKPEMNTGVVRYHQLEMRTEWMQSVLPWMPVALIGCISLSVSAFLLNRYRSRRRQDGKNRNLWLLLVLILLSVVFYWTQIR